MDEGVIMQQSAVETKAAATRRSWGTLVLRVVGTLMVFLGMGAAYLGGMGINMEMYLANSAVQQQVVLLYAIRDVLVACAVLIIPGALLVLATRD